jgi:enoyl-[acyl-carrier protein] reductase I
MLDGKLALVAGVANRRSIAWGIAEALHARGVRLAFTYQGERVEKEVRKLAATVDSDIVVPCDVRDDGDLDRAFERVGEGLGGLDLMVHSVAFAQKHDMEGRFVDTARDDFWLSFDISVYSLVAMSRRAEPLMKERGGGSILTMTFLGGERAFPRYNVMGIAKAALDASVRQLALDLGESDIRVNAISAGPVRTLAGRSIPGFSSMEEIVAERSPLHRNIDVTDVGEAAAYLLDARNVTGTIQYVDAGYHAMGL